MASVRQEKYSNPAGSRFRFNWIAVAVAMCYPLAYLPSQALAFTINAPGERTAGILSSSESPNNEGDVGTLDLEENVPTVQGVTLKLAFDSSDVWGVADLSEEKSERFTSPESLDLVHRLRTRSDAVLVGRGTVQRDDCTLTVRRVPLPSGRSQPVRVVLDPNQSIFRDEASGTSRYKLLHDGLPTILYHALDDDESVSYMDDDSVTSVAITASVQNSVSGAGITAFQRYLSPSLVLDDLSSRGIQHVMVEGGPSTARSFLHQGVVDRAILIRAPMCFRKPLESLMTTTTLSAAGLEKLGSSTCNGDTVEYWSKPDLPWPTPDLEQWP